ncbi:MAG TPA: helix-turn-helix domain-containing protein, partial [Mycobacteriales bacterium]|nr:helix-turn-helix domain-containing protein [Mycobacteriales bacterium]
MNPEDLPEQLGWLATAWKLAPPPRRGPKPAHSVEEIVSVAIELADRGGIEEVSLPKIAHRIGVTTNALYRYVGSKDELLQLLNDAAVGDPPRLGRRGWRAAAADWSHALIGRYRRHPWMLDIPIHGAPITPNSLGWVEVLLQALD